MAGYWIGGFAPLPKEKSMTFTCIERALVVGLGSIGVRHLQLLREVLPNADIRVLRHSGCTDDIPNANGCFDRLEDACKFAPQMAVISSPAPFHLNAAAALARAGAHLLVEKPISDSAEGVHELLALCAEEGRLLQVGYNLRFLDTLQCFRSELNSGSIGKIHTVRHEIGQYLPDWRPGVDYRASVSARQSLGGGVLLELSHELDMLRWIFGEIVWLGAWMGRQSTLEIDVEDSAMLQMGFETGTVAQLGMDFLRRDTSRVCTAIGSEGSLRWNAAEGWVKYFKANTGTWTELAATQPERNASYRAQLDSFLCAISTGQPDSIAASGADGLAVMRLIEAARRSNAEDGRRIKLEDVAA
jgi:predicted dehydrogenase